jgi:hypothetical protein
MFINDRYKANGLVISPFAPHAQDSVKVLYNGLLLQNGANEVWVHVGFGEKWDKAHDYKMEKTDNGFEVNFMVQYSDTLNIAFRDSASNWDNNSGDNYSFGIAH